MDRRKGEVRYRRETSVKTLRKRKEVSLMQQNAATFSISEVPSDGKSNGDGAEWIRKGVEYSLNAEFQLDKFHWLRSLRRAVGCDRKALRALREKLESEDSDEEARAISLTAKTPIAPNDIGSTSKTSPCAT